MYNLKISNIDSIVSNVFNDFLNGDVSSFNSYITYFDTNSDNPNIHFLKQDFLYNFSFKLSEQIRQNNFIDISNIDSSYLLKSIFVTDWIEQFDSNYSTQPFVNFFNNKHLSDNDYLKILLSESLKLTSIFNYLNLNVTNISKISDRFSLSYSNYKDTDFDIFKKFVFIYSCSQLPEFKTQQHANSALEFLFKPLTSDKKINSIFSYLNNKDFEKQISNKIQFINQLPDSMKKVIFLLSNNYSKEIISKSLIDVFKLKGNGSQSSISNQIMNFLSSLEYSELLYSSQDNKIKSKTLKI